MTTHVFNKVSVTPSQVVNCSYSNWSRLFPKFVTKSKVFSPLPKAFLEYLESDSIILHDDGDLKVVINSDNDYSEWESEDSEDEVEKDNQKGEYNKGLSKDQPTVNKSKVQHKNPIAGFEKLHNDINLAIKELGGSITPKLNWSSPKDAKWILPNSTTRCFNANDVYLLLNSSDHIVHDLDHAFDDCYNDGSHVDQPSKERKINMELVLREWVDINPALEFRVFVKRNQIIGISQRDLNYYDYLDSLKTELGSKITSFCKDHVIGIFPDADFIIDLYVPRPFTKVWIVDINTFSRSTDSLLFTWHELTEVQEKIEAIATEEEVDFRLVTEHNVGRFAAKEHSENYVPRDIVDASLDSSAMANLAREWNKLSYSDDSGSDDEVN
ncbi:cell division cycle protein 123 [[Candida] railenensis]|uniref:Cell division cycle protein 123 n=1 Tax=[Candida] railenensis TaxID=45579 RepID=A0A9P0QM55_9ASCO|nr:cell division cycle protein 123 [[Candida] railenensis]